MPKQKNSFQIKKIRRRKKTLPVSKLTKLKRFFRQYKPFLGRTALVVLVVLTTFFVHHYQKTGSYLFRASILEAPLPFSGTVYPVDLIPDWTHWNGNNHTTHFNSVSSNLLVALPSYDLQQMQFPSQSLEWGNDSHDLIRNTKITYSVPYLGNYKLDHQEGVGSHLAVDIRMPVGTPIKNIANGRVVKVSMTESGFGHHVVIKHSNVPDPDDSGKKTTLFSAFNHMDEINVTEGQSVSKGAVIGTSGNTGTSTTPHLHFQIDRDSAPWHPYWPFSWTEAQEAGLSFFEAVNAGLGLPNARRHTVNPMKFVEKHLNYDGDSHQEEIPPPQDQLTEQPPHESDDTDDQKDGSKQEVEEETPDQVRSDKWEVDTTLFSFRITGEPVSLLNNGVTLTVIDEQGQIKKMSDSDELRVKARGVGQVSKKVFRKSDFRQNSIQLTVSSAKAGQSKIEVGKTVFSINFIEQVKPIAGLRVQSDGNFQKGQVEVIELVALNEDGEPTPVVNFSGVINVTAKEGQAVFTPGSLEARDFKNGIAQVRMTSQGEDRVVVRAQSGAIVGESDAIYAEAEELFLDVPKNHPNYQAIKQLEENGIVQGYPDGRFQPEKTVNRVEALKMLMLAFDVEVGPAGSLPFYDTEDGAWYAGTLATALKKEIVKGYADKSFKPANTVNKAEYLKILFLTAGIQPNEDLAGNPYEDVPKNAWYAGFAYLLNKKNLLDVGSQLHAAGGMTRGDVAETIYRLKYIQDNNLLTYSN